MGQTLIEGLDGHLLQVRVIQPDLLTIGNQQLLHRRIGVPAEQAGAFQRQLACSFLQLRTAAIQRQLGKSRGDGLRLVKQFGQALNRHLIVGYSSDAGKTQQGQH